MNASETLQVRAETSEAVVRVAFVIQTYHPVVGGAEQQLQSLLPLMQRQGIEPVVVTRGLSGQPSRDTVNGVPVIRCGSNHYGVFGGLVFILCGLWTLLRQRPAVVHAFSMMSPATIGMLHRVFTGTPLAIKALRGGAQGDYDRISNKPLFSVRRYFLSRYIDAAQVISDEIDVEFEHLGLSVPRRHRIANGVDVERLAAQPSNTLRAEYGIADDASVSVYVGRLVREKEVDRLINQWLEIYQNDDNHWLLIAGTGPEQALLLKLAAACERIKLIGQCDDVPRLLHTANVFVQPSSTEGMSNSMLEAMAAGMTIVATDVGAARELIGENERGYLIPAQDNNALKAALQMAFRQGRASRLGKLAQDYVREHHNITHTAEQLSRIYFRLSQSRHEP